MEQKIKLSGTNLDEEILPIIILSVLTALFHKYPNRKMKDIEDAVSEAILLFFEKATDIIRDDPNKIGGYLYMGAINMLNNEHRRHNKYNTFSESDGIELTYSSLINIEKSLSDKDHCIYFLDHLSLNARKIVEENESGKTLAEIAHELGKSIKSVEKAHERAMKKMHEVWELEKKSEDS